ncbi:50S ribosomal protein L39e [Desulfurococcus mucosus]|uniref:Large ribosomal subunit protein eL39 n=1 Tax=Desulfurococcus mucosus (strain ATCC 35584 / DSM 2162 / JCM 9187 / O7/1) TaxID=765177 RepID=E8RAB4_DESM0|nr:50S ribosomal protein L39e [Desulfurococcus mucosus]ADV65420.1 LSU ribosomal protein L39E [Desulfurococcus mucosus DSM 2162]
MARFKHVARKLRLAAALKSNRAIPIWVSAKTRLRVRRGFALRNWRRSKLKNI